MNKKGFVVVVGVALAFAMAGGLIASNMGFKLNYPLAAADGGATSATGTNTIALPFNRQSGIDTASALLTDIGGTAVVQNVQTFLEASDGLQVYTGRKGSGPDFALSGGEGYFVRMSAPVDYIVVGSHDPSLAVELNAADGGATSATGTNFFAYPYHATALTASALLNDIGGTAVVQNVQTFLESSDGLQVYTGRKGSGPDFNLVPGEAYFVRMSSTVAYVPSHY